MDETIKKIVGGLRYDTQTATKICTYESGAGRRDFKFECTALYRTPRGRFFVAGHGGALSRWASPCGNNGWIEGDGLIPLTAEDARDFAERHADADTIAKFFEFEDA